METHVRTLARAQVNLGAQVEVFCLNHAPGPTTRETDGPVAVVRFRRLATVAKLDVCPRLLPALAQVEADILHLHVPNPAMLLAVLAARPRAPLVVTYHSDMIRQRLSKLLFRPLERLAYRRVRAVLATNPNYVTGSTFLRSYADRLDVLPLGIDLAPFLNPSPEVRELAAQLRVQCGGPLWLSCGRLIYYKGLLNAIRALPHTPGTLVIVGDGPEKPNLEAEAKRLAVSARVVLAGSVPDRQLPAYYHAACAFWFPSNARSEAFGLVQVEAMASGCPVINTAIPGSGVPWVSRHEETGLTIPPDDPAALAAAAKRLLTESGLREWLSGNARERALREFDHRVMAERSLEIYRRVLARERRRHGGQARGEPLVIGGRVPRRRP
jgi:rhamnosyl/mannosyltransferase